MSNYAKTTIVINEDIYQTLLKDEAMTDYFDAIDASIENAYSLPSVFILKRHLGTNVYSKSNPSNRDYYGTLENFSEEQR